MNKKIKKIADYYSERYGTTHQDFKACEECGELIQAISQFYNARDEIVDYEPYRVHLAEEIADVEIMTAQLKYLWDVKGMVKIKKKEKIERQLNRIGDENE